MSDEGHTSFSAVEAHEIRQLLADLSGGKRSQRRMAWARLRRMGYVAAAGLSPSAPAPDLNVLVASGVISIDDETATARIAPHRSGNIFRVAVGFIGGSVDAAWSAFDQRYQWFGKEPRSVTSGAHLFVLAVDRWRSAVVGLYETVSAGAARLPHSPDADRWPWALGVRPLAAILPPDAVRVDGQRGPQSGLPERISDQAAWRDLYVAVAASPPPPGPTTLEQRVQELEPQDVAEDVRTAVHVLGRDALHQAVIERAIELGGWTDDELAARAWYTGSGPQSHIRNIVVKALRDEHALHQRLERVPGSGRYVIRQADRTSGTFGVAYRPAAQRQPTAPDDAPHRLDLAALDAATARHMALQDLLAEALRERGIEPRSPGSYQPQFDLAFEHAGQRYVVEVKTGAPVSAQQVRLGVGQILEYCHLMRDAERRMRPVLLLESGPPDPWTIVLADELGIAALRGDRLGDSVDKLLAEQDSLSA